MQNTVYPRLSLITYLGFEFNSLSENSESDAVDFNYVYTGISQKNLFKKLEVDFKEFVDFSTLNSDAVELENVYNSLSEIADNLRGQERRKMGVEKNGINLLIAFVLELIQRQSHKK